MSSRFGSSLWLSVPGSLSSSLAPMPTPATSAQSYCTEAARAAALASHSAASLAVAAGFREAARLLRSSEALARAATAALLAIPRRAGGASGGGDGVGEVISGKKKRPKKKKGKQNEKEDVLFGPELPPSADGVLEVDMVASTSSLSPRRQSSFLARLASWWPGLHESVLHIALQRHRHPHLRLRLSRCQYRSPLVLPSSLWVRLWFWMVSSRAWIFRTSAV